MTLRGAPSSVAPSLWVTDEPVADAGAVWLRIRAAAIERGLVAVVLDTDEGRWWDSDWYFDPTEELAPGDLDVESVLRGWWDVDVPDEVEDDFDGPRVFPGLAAPITRPADVAAVEAEVATLRDRHLGLVPGERQGDAPARLRWMGTANAQLSPFAITTVLWSWEVRFGALLVQLGHDTMDVFVSRPPRTYNEAWAIALEHYALCPDIIEQGVGSIGAQAEALAATTRWQFWWD